MKKQDVDSAITEYKQALQNDFDTPFVHYELGRALEQKGDLSGAAKEIQKAYKEMPQNQTFREAHDRLVNSSRP